MGHRAPENVLPPPGTVFGDSSAAIEIKGPAIVSDRAGALASIECNEEQSVPPTRRRSG